MRGRDRERSKDDRLLELATVNGQGKNRSREQPEEVNGSGITIRGLAGPYVVMASNFAPGTTSADIESAMVPIGGEMQSCRIMASSPTVIAEMVFVDKKGADAVIETFNNQKVRTLQLFAHLVADSERLRPMGDYFTSTPSQDLPPAHQPRDQLPLQPQLSRQAQAPFQLHFPKLFPHKT